MINELRYSIFKKLKFSLVGKYDLKTYYVFSKKWLTIVIFMSFYCFSYAQITITQSKPNIVLFIADDLNHQDLGCYGNREVKTPNIDLLAAEGMRFTRAYAASPMCSPSRGALFTGQYPYKNGIQMNHFIAKDNVLSLPQYLKKQGYRVVISGKIHVGPEECFPFEHIGKEFGIYEPIENRLDKKKETVNFIKQNFNQKDGPPICLIVAPWVPHVPWFPNRDFDPNKLTLPDYLADTKETRHALASYYQSIFEADKFFGEIVQVLKDIGKEEQTLTMFISDQGAQFPSAKWSIYDQGIRVPLIAKWPSKIKRNTISNALISLVDIAPTFIDIAGGQPVMEMDGRSIKNILLGKKDTHHKYIFAETSMEPHFWYNYTPGRCVVTNDDFHYIKNYNPGLKFVTHIDKIERNEFYFDSWVEKSKVDSRTAFLLNRYSYRSPEELYNLNTDKSEFINLADKNEYKVLLVKLRNLLFEEMKRQGESQNYVLDSFLPVWGDRSFEIKQNNIVSFLSFNKTYWKPDTLYVSAYLDGINKGGLVCDYFNNLKIFAYKNQIGIVTSSDAIYRSKKVETNGGHLLIKITSLGKLEIEFNQNLIIEAFLNGDFTKIKDGYVSCGQFRGKKKMPELQKYEGKIMNLIFSME